MKRLSAQRSKLLFLAGCLAGQVAGANIIDDTYGAGAGSFELGVFVNGGGIANGSGNGYMGLAPGSTTMTGWSVGGPGDGVDWLISPNFGANSGVHSVDLQHLTDSSVSTVIPTVAGTIYQISFSAAAPNVFSNSSNTVTVSAGTSSQQFTAPPSSNTASQVFAPFSFLYTAANASTTIRFTATGTISAYGPVIDSVNVIAVPEPASALLFCIGLASAGAYSKLRKLRES